MPLRDIYPQDCNTRCKGTQQERGLLLFQWFILRKRLFLPPALLVFWHKYRDIMRQTSTQSLFICINPAELKENHFTLPTGCIFELLFQSFVPLYKSLRVFFFSSPSSGYLTCFHKGMFEGTLGGEKLKHASVRDISCSCFQSMALTLYVGYCRCRGARFSCGARAGFN